MKWISSFRMETVSPRFSWEESKEHHERAFVEFKKKFPRAEEGVCISRKSVEDFLKD